MRDNRRMASEKRAREHPYARSGDSRREEPSGRTVGEVAALARVTVRALHHYDEIALVSPSGRSEAGYRLYSDADLERLQQVLFYRELGFALDDIREAMTAPDFDRAAALREQRRLLEEQGERLQAMIDAVDAAIAAHEGGYVMNENEMFEVFDGFDPREFEPEVRERWGDTEAYRQSHERARQYSKDDWLRMKAEVDAINQSFIQSLDSGAASTSTVAMGVAEEHRQHITRWFYECQPEMHRGLGELFVQDPRFAATWDALRPGLAEYVSAAFIANAEAQS